MMVVLIVESAPPSLRGELTKWMIEPKAGVYLGSISGAVRDLLWEKACTQVGKGGCTMIYSAANEQGFAIRSHGDTTRDVTGWEGLYLVRRLPRVDDRIMARADTVMRLWAKADPFQPLPCHLIDVGHVAVQLLHTTAFSSVRRQLIEATGSTDAAIDAWVGYIAALHDWGKCWRNFQGRPVEGVHPSLHKTDLNLNIEDRERSIRHEAISRIWLEEHLREQWGWDTRSCRTVGAAIGAHHGRLGLRSPELLPFPGVEKWHELRVETENMVRAAFQPEPWSAQFLDHSVVGMLLVGLVTWADWIASNVELFPLRWRGEPWADYNELSRIAAERAVQKLGLTSNNPWQEPRLFSQIWPDFSNPRPIQRSCEALVQSGMTQGLVIIEAPMGEGKSEAAYYIASQWMQKGGGMYVGLPTAATSNQMFGRVQEFIDQHDPGAGSTIQLVHGASWLIDRASPQSAPEVSDEVEDPKGEFAYSWFLPRKRSLLSTYGVGTIDQALMSVLKVKHGFLRLFGLAGKTLIIDEVHAYDAYMTEILTLLLTWCRVLNISVILLSATLPQRRKLDLVDAYLGGDDADSKARGGTVHDLGSAHAGDGGTHADAPYPLITAVDPGGNVREIAVPKGERSYDISIVRHEGLLGDPHGIADLAVQTLGSDGCICIIANTVGSAQEIYHSLKSRYAEIDTLLFHGRFLAKDRQMVENRALEWFDKRSLLPANDPKHKLRPKKAILVATQVVEQSLDLDFDAMITEIAPMDLLLQRSGRLHRHTRPGRPQHLCPPTLHIVLPPADSTDFGSCGHVYEPYTLLRTRLALGNLWRLPDDMRNLVETVYSDTADQIPDHLRSVIQTARDKMEANKDKLAKAAEVYCIPTPHRRSFKLDRTTGIVFEEDDGLSSYLTAKTRHGNETAAVLFTDLDEWREIEQLTFAPNKRKRSELMMQTVSVPRWWLREVIPAEGHVELAKSPRWLSSVERVIVTQNGKWFGITPKGKRFAITVGSELGVTYTEMEG